MYTVVGDGTVSAMVLHGTDPRNLAPTIEHNGASVDPTSGVFRDFSSPVRYVVTAADGTTREYVVTVTVQTELDAAKISAYAALRSALAGYSQGDYSQESWEALNGFKEIGDAAIDFSGDVDAVAFARTTALDEMAGVPTNAELSAIDAATSAVATAEGVKTRETVNTAQTLVSALPNGSAKTALQARIDTVQLAIDIDVATAAVTAAEKAGTQGKADEAQTLVSALPKGSDRTALQDRIGIVQLTIDIDVATAAVTAAENAGTSAAVSMAQTLISALPGGSTKAALQARIDAVRSTIDSDAVLAVSNLISALPSLGALSLSDDTRISRVRGAYDSLTDIRKTSVTNYSVLQAVEAQVSILATATSAVATAEGAKTRETVNTAQTLVSALPGGSAKAALQARIDAVLSGIDLTASVASAKLAAHEALQIAFLTHHEADYVPADWTTLRGLKMSGDIAINAASDTALAIAAKMTAIDGMASIKTISQTDPDPVRDLRAEYRPATKAVRLTWKADGDTATEVYIYRGSTDHFSTRNRARIAMQDSGDESYADEGVSPGMTYYYKVSAVNTAGNASEAETAKVVVPMDGTGAVKGAPGVKAASSQKTSAVGSGAVASRTDSDIAQATTNRSGTIKNNGVVLGTSVEKTGKQGSFWGSAWMWPISVVAVFGAILIWRWRRLGDDSR